jgi:predicted RNA-binding Zn-ribbon protein involved in translation (DUF1610 family)
VSLFCPKCGKQLSENRAGYFECVRGDMPLAWELAERLNDCYVKKIRSPMERSCGYPVGGMWYCLGCGVEIKEEKHGDLRCPLCCRSISEFIHSLIERHPHRDGTGGWM